MPGVYAKRGELSEMNIAHHMQRARFIKGAQDAVAVGATVVSTYAELGARVAKLASGINIVASKLAARPSIALVMKNSPEYLEVLYACWHAGCVVVPINSKLHSDEIRLILKESTCSICFFSNELQETVMNACRDTSTLMVNVATAEYRSLSRSTEVVIAPKKPEDPAWIFYTSGTTGKPKGAILTHGNLMAMAACYFLDIDPYGPWTSIIHAAPMSHGSGLYSIPHTIKASCHIIPDSSHFDAVSIFKAADHWPGSVFFAAPTMIKVLVSNFDQASADAIRLIIYGGGPMYLADITEAIEVFGPKFVQLYGQGECPMAITALSQDIHADSANPQWETRLGSVGVPQTMVEIKVIDESGCSLAPGNVGQVLVKGAPVMKGYFNNSQATQKSLSNGWLHTGDFGELTPDGFLVLKDRRTDLIISGGMNIYPREVEEVLLSHEGVSEAAVIGLQDSVWGERVVAYVVKQAGLDACPEELDRQCLSKIARFKRPKEYRFINSLPKNSYGKVLKAKLKAIASHSEPLQ